MAQPSLPVSFDDSDLWQYGADVVVHEVPPSQQLCLDLIEKANTQLKPVDSIKAIHSSQGGKIPEIAFGKAKWKKYFDLDVDEPPLPANIDDILASDCPFFL